MRAILLIVAMTAPEAIASEASAAHKPEPSKELVVRVCFTDYDGRNMRCQTRQLLEKRADDLVYIVKHDDGREGELILTPHLSPKFRPFSPATFVPHSYILQFPLEIGSSWRGTYDQTSGGSTRNRTRTATVKDYGDLTLKAGTFKAFRIDAFNQWSEARRPAVEIYHYCPEISMICKYESREFDLKEEVVEVIKGAPR